MEEKATKEETKLRRKAKPVAVSVIARKGKSALVEWGAGDGLKRAFVPADLVEGDAVNPEVLAQGIPYGVPWAELVDTSGATPANFQAEMHRNGIWTVADLEAKPKILHKILPIITGINLGALRGAARKHERGG